ncbi:MAG TPA: nuclear transport factor 2 family protein [Novosphingobium sp.]
MASDAEIQALIDKDAIRDLIHAYCRAVDRLDVALGHSVWHADGYADYGAGYYRGPGRGVIDTICEHHLGLLSHAHRVTNILIALDGDDAGSESYVAATLRLEREGKPHEIAVHARYLDRWQRRAGRWGLLHRVVVFDHQDIREVMALPGHGLPAARDASDPSYPVLKG